MNYELVINHINKQSGFKNQKEMVIKFSEWLDISEASIYNKINGRSRFSVEELLLICQKTNVSLDNFIQNQQTKNSYVPFYADGLKYKPRNFSDYISNIIGYYTKIRMLKDVHGYFLANEVPMFHLLCFPHLMYLKLYMWNRINWKMEEVSKSFDYQDFKNDADLTQNITILRDLYYSFPDTEIWNPYMLDNTIAQYLYLREINVIKTKDDHIFIKKEFSDLVDYLEDLTTKGKKPFNNKNIEMDCNIYINDINLGSEVILVKSDQYDLLFQQIDVPNYMRTTDQRMVANQFQFFENIKKISTFITYAGEKERLTFFARLRLQLDRI
jgi:hypothetical protein